MESRIDGMTTHVEQTHYGLFPPLRKSIFFVRLSSFTILELKPQMCLSFQAQERGKAAVCVCPIARDHQSMRVQADRSLVFGVQSSNPAPGLHSTDSGTYVDILQQHRSRRIEHE